MSDIYIPYTYLVGWSQHKLFYYGSRTCKSAHPSDLWVKYFTSSKYVKEARKSLGEPDIIEVRKCFSDGESAWRWELRVLKKIGAVKRKDFLNKTDRCGIKSFGKPLSKEHRQNISKGIEGKVIISEAQREKIRQSNSTRKVSNKVRDACAQTAKLEVTRLAVSRSNKTRVTSDETRAKLAAAIARRNADPLFIAQRKAGMNAKKGKA